MRNSYTRFLLKKINRFLIKDKIQYCLLFLQNFDFMNIIARLINRTDRAMLQHRNMNSYYEKLKRVPCGNANPCSRGCG